MRPQDPKSRTERDQTDESLRSERERVDLARAEAQASVEHDADAVVDLARRTADAVLGQERKRADRRLGSGEPQVLEAVLQQRALADEVVRGERGKADEMLGRERAECARALADLMLMERDETDRYLLTERARSDTSLSNRDDFLGIVSHDLRNLLGGILLSAEVLSGDASDTDDGRRVAVGAKRIQRYVARMNRLISDLVDVASIEAGKLAMSMRRADAVPLVAETVDTFRSVAGEKRISLETKILERELLAYFDHERMLQVLANLISNGLKFTPPGGVVCIRAAGAVGELRISVADTGAGIPGAMLEAVFERFWQVKENDRRGVGLGLYISKHIVEAHGGKIWAESRMGQGSQVHLTIPVALTA